MDQLNQRHVHTEANKGVDGIRLPVSLRDLEKYRPIQEQLIQGCAPLFEPEHIQCKEWEAFRKSVWRSSLEKEESFDRVTAIDLGNQPKLLVRAEYTRADPTKKHCGESFRGNAAA